MKKNDFLINPSEKKYSRSEFFAFFLDRLKIKKTIVHPPYAVDEDSFVEICPECQGRCVPVCPQQIIKRNDAGVPRLDFSTVGCTFCGACVDACELEVLQQGQPERVIGDIHLDFSVCLAWQGTICQCCTDICPERAIFFDGMKNPNIRKDVCTRCGFCLAVCPVNSIHIGPVIYVE